MTFLPAQFSWIWCKFFQTIFLHSNIFQSDWIQRSYREKLTDHYACKNADLNLRLVAATSNRFIFQIIDSLIQSLGLRLTCLDCNNSHNYLDYVLTTSGENGHWSLLELKGFSLNLDVAWKNSRHFAMHQRFPYEMTPEEGVQKLHTGELSLPMQDLGSASDWLKLCFSVGGFMKFLLFFSS